jgi:5-methylcytosine-specific restriction protein A
MQPEVSRRTLLAAMHKFDRQSRDEREWADWEDNKAHKYAIQHGRRIYPVKKIVSLASGVDVGQFSGGRYPGNANGLVEACGFRVVPLRGANPDWERDELILALNLYLRRRSNPPSKASREIRALSRMLNRLGKRLFPASERSETFRNPNGVYMKLMNFRRLDPEYTGRGKRGLTAGAKSEEEVWEEFANDPQRCQEVANAIVASLDDPEGGSASTDLEVEDFTVDAPEGRLLTRKHIGRERNRKLIDSKKKQVLKQHGKLVCEICRFDFAAYYGVRGEGFIECHHTKPLATLTEGHRTHLDDLALVCANCHRMIHRAKPWLSIERLRQLIRDDCA